MSLVSNGRHNNVSAHIIFGTHVMITNHYPLSTLPHSHFSGTVCINILVTRLTGLTGILIFELEREVAVVTKIVDTATDLYHQVFVVFVDCFIIA